MLVAHTQQAKRTASATVSRANANWSVAPRLCSLHANAIFGIDAGYGGEGRSTKLLPGAYLLPATATPGSTATPVNTHPVFEMFRPRRPKNPSP